MADDDTSDDLPRRRSPELPPGFGPLQPLSGADAPAPARRTPGEPPKLRLTSSAARRNAPDRAAAASPGPDPVPIRDESAPDIATPPPPPPTPAPGRGPGRRGLAAAIVVALAALVGATVLLWPSGRNEPTDATDTAAAPEAAVPSSTGQFDPPLALEPDSEYVETELVDEDLVVTHWISTTEPMARFRLRTPSSPGLADLVVDVQDLEVAADGVAVDASDVRTDVPGVLPSPTRLYVRYRLAGAVERNSSVESRALATVTSLGLGVEGRSLPRTQAFPGGRVMTLACLGQGARAVPEPCGTYEEGEWRVVSPPDEAPVAVVAQLDLAVDR